MTPMPNLESRKLFSRLKPAAGRKRWLAAFAAGLAVMGGIALAQGKPSPVGLTTGPIDIRATPIAAFDRTDASRTGFGALEFLGGMFLTSPSPNFGGWSGLAVSPDGATLYAVSDAGTWMGAAIARTGRRLTGLENVRIGPLKARDGKTLSRGRDRDAEAISLAAGTLTKGEVLIAFEQNDRIGRFAIGSQGISAPSAYIAMPDAARAMRGDGFESVTALPGGGILAIAESALRGKSRHAAWLWQRGTPNGLEIESSPGFEITDAAALDDGTVFFLERRFNWMEGVSMKLRRIAPGQLRPGSFVRSELLAEADLGQEIDNMEGLAVRRDADGSVRVLMISDNNFNTLLQRTVLLEFALGEGRAVTQKK